MNDCTCGPPVNGCNCHRFQPALPDDEYMTDAARDDLLEDLRDELAECWAHRAELLAELGTVQLQRDELLTLAGSCPLCSHERQRHDPEDGQCDAPAGGSTRPIHDEHGIGAGPCQSEDDKPCPCIAYEEGDSSDEP